MKIYLLLAHPDRHSFNGRLADAYEQSLKRAGHEVKRQDLGEMDFDPILRKGYKEVQELEPGLKTALELIFWCEHWVIFYPVWWGSVPALLKGFFDRTLLPGTAFRYHKKGPFWDRLLSGRSARLITTCDAPSWWLWWQYRNSDLNMVKRAILFYCGITPVHHTRIDRLRFRNERQRGMAIKKILKLPECIPLKT